MDMSEFIARQLEGVFRCAWGNHDAPLAEADPSQTICLDHLDEVAELEEREYQEQLAATIWREVV